jgi:hypothetical protein
MAKSMQQKVETPRGKVIFTDTQVSLPQVVEEESESVGGERRSVSTAEGGAVEETSSEQLHITRDQGYEQTPTGKMKLGRSSTPSADSLQAAQMLSMQQQNQQMLAMVSKMQEALVTTQSMMRSMQLEHNQSALQMQQQIELLRNRPTDTLTYEAGAEAWIAERRLQEDLQMEYIWWDIELDCPENRRQSQIRLRLWQHCKKQLPSTFHYSLYRGDIKGVYINVANLGQADASTQVHALRQKLAACTKSGRSMSDWLKDLYEIWSDLQLLQSCPDHAQCRQLVIENISSDSRYKDVLRDIMRNTSWSLDEIRDKLITAASNNNDLIGPNPKKLARLKKKENKKKKKEEAEKLVALNKSGQSNANSIDTSGSANTTTTGTNQQRHVPAGKHTKKGKAEGSQVPEETKKRLRKEICRYFLMGACTNGDACLRQHITLEKLQAAHSQKGVPPGGAPMAKNQQGKKDPCAQFAANGQCSFGDKCKYLHSEE